MVKALSYKTISHVLDSWERLRRIDNYEEIAGAKLFQRLFEKAPKAKLLFGFPLDTDPTSEELLHSRRFLAHAKHMIQMVDTALGLLGPDIELLTDIMKELGVKHVKYGVTPDMFPIMGECLWETLEETLPRGTWTDNTKKAWKEIYQALSDDMLMLQKKKKRSTSTSTAAAAPVAREKSRQSSFNNKQKLNMMSRAA